MKKLFCLLCLLSLNCSTIVFANQFGGMNPGTLNSQTVRDLRMHEVTTRAKQRSAIVQPKTAQMEKQVIPEVVTDLKSVKFTNNVNFPSTQLQEVVKGYINKPLTAENIAKIRRTLMKFYQSKGFYSAVPIIVSQNGSTGELIIEINEGSKNSITFE